VLSARTLTTVSELGQVREEWDRLVRAARRPSPFLLHGWLEAWCRHFAADGLLRIHLVERADGRLLGALPLVVTRTRGLRVAQFVGGGQSALADLLLAPDAPAEAAGELVRLAHRSGHDYADLFGVAGESNLSRVTGALDLKLVERVEAPVLDLSAGFDAVYREKTSSKRRNLHKRRVRQLSELGRVEFRLARTSDELAAALEDAFVLHRLRWSGRPDGSGFGTDAGMRFHREAVQALAPLDVPRIVTLTVDDRPIAFHYFFAFCGGMYVHRLAFDPAFGRYSPGAVTTLETIRMAAGEGLERVEYLGGDERYKVEFADRLDPLYQALGMAPTAAGRVSVGGRLAIIAARRRLKRSKRLRALYFEGLAPARRAWSLAASRESRSSAPASLERNSDSPSRQ